MPHYHWILGFNEHDRPEIDIEQSAENLTPIIAEEIAREYPTATQVDIHWRTPNSMMIAVTDVPPTNVTSMPPGRDGTSNMRVDLFDDYSWVVRRQSSR